jgi:hypothetical protein
LEAEYFRRLDEILFFFFFSSFFVKRMQHFFNFFSSSPSQFSSVDVFDNAFPFFISFFPQKNMQQKQREEGGVGGLSLIIIYNLRN